MLPQTKLKSVACLVPGDCAVFYVEIKATKRIAHLKDKIKAMKMYKFAAHRLTLYLAKRDGHWVTGDDLEGENIEEAGKLPDNQDQAAGDDNIHVLVTLPTSKRRRLDPGGREPFPESATPAKFHAEDHTEEWCSRFRATFVSASQLPQLAALPTFIAQELETKIPVDWYAWNLWELHARASMEDSVRKKLFVVGGPSPCPILCSKVVVSCSDPMSGSVTENAYIPFWDSLFRRPLETIFKKEDAEFGRNTSRSASMETYRPDFLFVLNQVCVFRGEENAGGGVDLATPEAELRNKLTWTYGKVPYLLGYAAAGAKCTLCALTSVDGRTVNTVALATFDANERSERFRLLLALLNLARLFRGIQRLCPQTGRASYKEIVCDRGVRVVLNPLTVPKKFPLTDATSIPHLRRVYDVLESNGVPNTDMVVRYSRSTPSVELRPCGLATMPHTLNDLFTAMENVLEALIPLHRASWMHRDLRWSNVMRRKEEEAGGWFLIDFTDVAESP